MDSDLDQDEDEDEDGDGDEDEDEEEGGITARRSKLVYNTGTNKTLKLYNVLETDFYIVEFTKPAGKSFDQQRVWKKTDDGVELCNGKIASWILPWVDQEMVINLHQANVQGNDVADGITLLPDEIVMYYPKEPYEPGPSENLEMEELNVPQWLPAGLVGPINKDALTAAVLGGFDASGLPAIIQGNMDEHGQPRSWEHVCTSVANARILSNNPTHSIINHIMRAHPECDGLGHFFKKTDLTVADLRLIERAVYDIVIVLEFDLEVELEVTKRVRASLEDMEDSGAETLADKFKTLLEDFSFADDYYGDVKDDIIVKYKQYLPRFSDVYSWAAVEECDDDGSCSWIGDYYMRFRFDSEADRLEEDMLEDFALERIVIPASSDFKEQEIAGAQQRLEDNVAAKEKAMGFVDAEDVAASAVGAAGREKCAICLEEVDALWILRCGHIVGCLDCTKMTIEHDGKCAICRQPVHEDDPQPVSQQIKDAVRFVEEANIIDAHSSSDEGAEFVE